MWLQAVSVGRDAHRAEARRRPPRTSRRICPWFFPPPQPRVTQLACVNGSARWHRGSLHAHRPGVERCGGRTLRAASGVKLSSLTAGCGRTCCGRRAAVAIGTALVNARLVAAFRAAVSPVPVSSPPRCSASWTSYASAEPGDLARDGRNSACRWSGCGILAASSSMTPRHTPRTHPPAGAGEPAGVFGCALESVPVNVPVMMAGSTHPSEEANDRRGFPTAEKPLFPTFAIVSSRPVTSNGRVRSARELEALGLRVILAHGRRWPLRSGRGKSGEVPTRFRCVALWIRQVNYANGITLKRRWCSSARALAAVGGQNPCRSHRGAAGR